MKTNTSGNNGVELTREQHQTIHFADKLGSTGSFIERLEMFLQEMDRRGLDGEPAGAKVQQAAQRQSTGSIAVIAHA